MGIATVATAQITGALAVTENLQGLPGTGPYEQNLAINPGAKQYGPTTTPPASYRSVATWTLVAETSGGPGLATIDLTDLPGMQDNIDGTGLKVQVFRIWGASTNGSVAIMPGDTNPYAMFGAGNEMDYPAANVRPFIFEFGGGAPEITDVSGVGASQIDLSGTDGDEFTIDILLG